MLSAKCRYHLKYEGTVSWTKKMGRKEDLTWFNPSLKIKYITATELSAGNLYQTPMRCKTLKRLPAYQAESNGHACNSAYNIFKL